MAKKHRAEQYAEDVRSGKVVACHWVKQAVERYYNDLDYAVEKGWYFDRKAAERAINFAEKFKHIKGASANSYLILEPWQCFVLWNLFGFKMSGTGLRRFREAYISVAKKNGKTTLAAPISLYMGIADKEMGAEVYYVAVTRDQARICFDTVKTMVEKSDLSKICRVYRDAVTYEPNGATFKALSSEARSLDGKSSHFVVIDEYHAHPTDEVYDMMQNSVVGRVAPMVFVITTAGANLNYPCYAYDKTMRKILDGVIESDHHFAIIYTLDDESEVHDPAMWIKANPCLNKSLPEDNLHKQYKQMKNSPYKMANILTKHFNMWVDAPTVWITNSQWGENNSVVPIERLKGKQCYAALDLANTQDYCCYLKMFTEEGRFQFVWKFYIPEAKFKDRYEMQREHANLAEWVKEGWVTITDGDVTDYDYILADVARDMEDYDIEAIAYDPWNSAQVAAKLTERGANMQAFSQTIGNYAYPTKEFSRIVLKGIVDHYNNPVARWMLSNVVIRTDANGNERPDKAKSAEKIDGIVAAIMALGQYLSDKGDTESVYEGRGLLGYDDEEDNNQSNEYDNGYTYDDDDY